MHLLFLLTVLQLAFAIKPSNEVGDCYNFSVLHPRNQKVPIDYEDEFLAALEAQLNLHDTLLIQTK
jgi:hypothetical protein